ncbi:MAG: LamG domain-containing protein [Pseudobdellovibrio sp.]
MKFIIIFSLIMLYLVDVSAQFIMPSAFSINTGELNQTWAPRWDSLIGYWRFNGPSNGNQITTGYVIDSDKSGLPSLTVKDGDGTANGVIGFDGNTNANPPAFKLKKSLKLANYGNGVSVDYARAGSANDFNDLSAITISVWAQVSETVIRTNTTVLEKKDSFGIYSCASDQRKICTYVKATSGTITNLSLGGVSVYADNNWNHIAMTFIDGGKVKLYFNGSLVGQSTGNLTGKLISNSIFTVGTNSDLEFSAGFPGRLDELAIWNVVLNSNQIKRIYDRQKRYSK